MPEWHRRLLGPEAQQGHLQAGLVALTSGAVIGLGGVALYLLGESFGAGVRLEWRKIAIAMAALAAPLIFGGLSLALPARLGLRSMAAAGAALNVTTVGLFFAHYPGRFNATALGSDRAPLDAALYALGSAILVAALLAQVVGVYVRGRGTPEENEWTEGYDVPDWVVERDIDEALARHPVSWGSGSRPAPGVEITVAGFGDEAIVRGDPAARRATLPLLELNQKTERLRGLTATSVTVAADGMTGAAAALGQLRRDQAAHPRQYRVRRRRWWHRLLHRTR